MIETTTHEALNPETPNANQILVNDTVRLGSERMQSRPSERSQEPRGCLRQCGQVVVEVDARELLLKRVLQIMHQFVNSPLILTMGANLSHDVCRQFSLTTTSSGSPTFGFDRRAHNIVPLCSLRHSWSPAGSRTSLAAASLCRLPRERPTRVILSRTASSPCRKQQLRLCLSSTSFRAPLHSPPEPS